MTFYVEGVPVATTDISSLDGDWNRLDGTYKIGTDRSETSGMEGKLDEVRLSGVLRSAGWIQTSYNNQSNPGTFYSISQESSSTYTPPTVSVVQPLDSATVETPVSYDFIPETHVPGATSRAQAQLWLNVTETTYGGVVYTDDTYAPQRAVIKDEQLIQVEGTGSSCLITVRDFPAGDIIKQGPVFGTGDHSNTSVVIDGDVIYGICTDGRMQAWNQNTQTTVWTITVGTGGSYYTTSNSMEIFDGHIYVQSADFVIHKINMATGTEVDSHVFEQHWRLCTQSPYVDRLRSRTALCAGRQLLLCHQPDGLHPDLGLSHPDSGWHTGTKRRKGYSRWTDLNQRKQFWVVISQSQEDT